MIFREKLTGRSRHRSDENGRLILQVECDHEGRAPSNPHWRDAKIEDLSVRGSVPAIDDSWADSGSDRYMA